MRNPGDQLSSAGSRAASRPAPDEIQRQLDKVCASDTFVKSRRLIKFLSYISERALAGDIDQLKEYTVGLEVFERDASYDPRIDTIVRTEARRLRSKLEQYYERGGRSDPILIEVPKGSYVPTFKTRAIEPGGAAGAVDAAVARPGGADQRMYVGVAAVVLATAGVWLALSRENPLNQPVLTRVTSDSGLNVWPALSPDGKLLAYSSDRSGGSNLDIFVQQVGSTADPLRVTSNKSDDRQAHFSPDGRRLVFRSERDGGGIYVVPALGGPERLLAPRGHRPRFSPDGKLVAYHVAWPGELYVVEASGGRPRRIQPDFASAQKGTWSPDGQQVLFEGQSTAGEDSFDWWVAPLDGGPAIRTGVVEALREHEIYVGWDWASPSIWTSDPDFVVASARQGESTNLWRFPISTSTGLVNGTLRRIGSGVGHEAQPSMSNDGLMAFAGLNSKVDVWTLPVDADAAQVTGVVERLSDNAANDIHPHVSRDGSRVVFISRRSGNRDVRLVNVEEAAEQALTDDHDSEERVKISGDRRTVIFTREEPDGRMAIYRVPADGETRDKLCGDCGHVASVSSDGGKVIYNVGRAFESRWFLLDAATGGSSRLFAPGDPVIYSPDFSPGDDRLVFEVWDAPNSGRIVATSLRGDSAAPRGEWVDISDRQHQLGLPQWSPDGNVIYYLSDRDGFRCIWARRMDAKTGRPMDDSFAVHHFHSARFAPFHKAYVGFSVAADKFVLSMEEKTGTIWLADPRP